MNPVLDPAFQAAVARSAIARSGGIGSELFSIVAVGSATTGEFSSERIPSSDIDLVAIFREEVPIESIRLFRKAVLADLAASPFPIGLRARSIRELGAFDEHMASWGYHMARHARLLWGSPIIHFLSASPRISDELLLRNLLGQLWWTVSQQQQRDATAVYALTRSVTELCHFSLVRAGVLLGTGTERLAAVREGAGPPWLAENLNVLEQAFALRAGRRLHLESREPLQRLWEQWFARLLSALLPVVDRLDTLRLWFPLGSFTPDLMEMACRALERASRQSIEIEAIPRAGRCLRVYPALAVLLCLHCLRMQPRRGAGHGSALLATAGETLGLLGAVPVQMDFETLRRDFARLQVGHCRAAAYDLEPHLQHLLPPPRESPEASSCGSL